jgi:TolB-like protein
VSVELIDAHTGGHLWAERFDRNRADLFDIQDEIARNRVPRVKEHHAVSGTANAASANKEVTEGLQWA